MKILIKDLKDNILNVLLKNMSEEDSMGVEDYLTYAEMCGNKRLKL